MFFDMFLLLIFDSSNYQLEDFYISRILKDQDSWRAAEAESPVPSVVQSGRQSNTSSFGNTTSKTITVRRLLHVVAFACNKTAAWHTSHTAVLRQSFKWSRKTAQESHTIKPMSREVSPKNWHHPAKLLTFLGESIVEPWSATLSPIIMEVENHPLHKGR